MAEVAILGSATIDQLVFADDPIEPGGTIGTSTWGGGAECGGAPIFAGRPLVNAGHRVVPILSLGDDEGGRSIRTVVRAAGFDDRAVILRNKVRTPRCLFIRQPDESEICLFDSGSSELLSLGEAQVSAIEMADVVMVAAAPAQAVEQLLAHISPGQLVAWIFKDDLRCFTSALCKRLMERADIIFCNRAEREKLDCWQQYARPSVVVFITLGGEGVELSISGHKTRLPTAVVAAQNYIGAGDTFAGHALAVLLNGGHPLEAAELALANTREFLKERELRSQTAR